LAKQRALQPIEEELPEQLKTLLSLQSSDGRFQDLNAVMECLNVPASTKFSRERILVTGECNYSDVEKACSYAIAEMRQNNHLFDKIVEYHDKAMTWIRSNELVFEAREIISMYRVNSKEENGLENSPDELNSDAITTTSEVTAESAMGKEFDRLVESQSTRSESQHNVDSVINSSSHMSDVDGSVEKINDTPQLQKTYSFSVLTAKLNEFTNQRDERAIAEQSNYLTNLQVEILDLTRQIEATVLEIIDCKNRCVAAYNSCETVADRYFTFDELTSRLGNGSRPVEGVKDWRKQGAPGLRPLIIAFFLKIHKMAEGKLLLQELQDPEKQSLTKKNQSKYSIQRWSLMWQGNDLVLRIMHCLDFLRLCRELSEWYGPEFYFMCNPLMLPFPYYPGFERLLMQQVVQDQLDSFPHSRRGLAVIEMQSGWQHQQFLNRWRFKFEELSDRWAFNWPSMVDMRDEGMLESMFTCLLVMYTCNLPSVKKSYLWEKKFISKISSTRGQDELLVGATAAKVDKKLEIPPLESRVSHIRTKLLNEGMYPSTMTDSNALSGGTDSMEQNGHGKFLSTTTMTRSIGNKNSSTTQLNQKGNQSKKMEDSTDQHTMSDESHTSTLSLPVAANAMNKRNVPVGRKQSFMKSEAGMKSITVLGNNRLVPLQANKSKGKL